MTKRPKALRVLVVDDSDDDAELVRLELARGGVTPAIERAHDAASFARALDRQSWDLVIADYSLPDFGALAALRVLRARSLDVPCIVLSGVVGEEMAVATMKAGAHDYLTKDALQRLAPAVERELREAESRRERRRAEEALRESEVQLRQSQKMEAIGRLAGGVAHDFNNLLTAIIGYAQIARTRATADSLLLEELSEITSAAQRAAALTRQLLAFSRRQVLQPRDLDVTVVIRGIEAMLRRVIGEDVELITDLASDLPLVRADAGQLEQIVVNLVVNARDAMPRGGRLTIRTRLVAPHEGRLAAGESVSESERVELSVSDDGEGMDDDTQSRIFEPFFTTKELGTGVGLSTVYGIARQSGGAVCVDSAPGSGTTMFVYLPLIVDSVDVAEALDDRARVSSGTETILLVEDDEGVRTLANRVLTLAGYTVMEAALPSDALALSSAFAGSIALVIADVVLPQMSGGELVRQLRVDRPSVSAIFMSGYSEHSGLDRGIAAEPFLSKPFTPEGMTGKVRDVLDAAAGELLVARDSALAR